MLFFMLKIDELVISRKTPFFVIPAKAGTQSFQLVTELLDSGFHRSDDFLQNHQDYYAAIFLEFRYSQIVEWLND